MHMFIGGAVIGLLIGLLVGKWITQTRQEDESRPDIMKSCESDPADWWKAGKEEDYTD